MTSVNTQLNLNTLPFEMLIEIFSKMPLDSVVEYTKVCKIFNCAAKHNLGQRLPEIFSRIKEQLTELYNEENKLYEEKRTLSNCLVKIIQYKDSISGKILYSNFNPCKWLGFTMKSELNYQRIIDSLKSNNIKLRKNKYRVNLLSKYQLLKIDYLFEGIKNFYKLPVFNLSSLNGPIDLH